MKQEILYGTIVAITVVVIVGIKTWLYKTLKFKMDESAILKLFKESNEGHKFHSIEAISSGTGIDTDRISSVCIKSKSIKKNTKEEDSWYLQ